MTDEKIEETRIRVRPSSLSKVASCPRNYLASRYTDILKAAHPGAFKERSGNYKMAVGTAFHKCMEDGLEAEQDIITAAEEVLREEHAKIGSNFFDDRYAEISDLVAAVKNMVLAFRSSPQSREWTTERNDGNSYELTLQSDKIDSGILFRGTIDCVRKDGTVIDLKTGQANDQELYFEQLTAYRMLLDHNPQEGYKAQPIAEVVKVTRPYSGKTDPEKIKAVRYSIDTRPNEKRVIQLVKKAADLVSQRDKWESDFTTIPANPCAKICSYCEIRNSKACPETKWKSL